MDYKKIGLKCGIEIHNRLATKHKLFCGCPPRFSQQKPAKTITRRLRAVAGELGEIDAAAAYEYLRNREFYYQVFSDATCLVEQDCEPPHALNKEALEVALQVAKMLHCEIPEEIHVMRKTVIDGSNTSGFQRTAIVGLNGYIETSLGRVRITNVCLEEESGGIVEQKQNSVAYRLDRLGIPLIEIGTAPDIKTPQHARETAEKLGMIIRSTGKSQRGLGTTRQDLNVSIAEGARVEIKGVQSLEMIPIIIEKEIERQMLLIHQGKKPKEETRLAKENGYSEYMRPLPGSERMYPETDVPPIASQPFLRKKLPESWEEKLKKFERLLPKQLAEQILKSEYLDLFEKFHKKYEPVLVANTLTSTIKELKREGVRTEALRGEQLDEIFFAVNKKQISKEAIKNVIETICREKVSVKEAFAAMRAIGENELREIIKKVLEENKDLVKEKSISALMGEIMKEVRGRIDGKTVARLLKEELEKV